MKKLLTIVGLAIGLTAVAQEYATANLSVANTLTSVLASPAKLARLTLTATSANATTFKLYDMAATTTSNVVLGAYYTPTAYSTNYDTTWTNITGPDNTGAYVTNIFTNTFSGTFTSWALTSAVTNERPRTVQITVPASSTRVIDVTRFLKFGLVAQANQTGLVEAEYVP